MNSFRKPRNGPKSIKAISRGMGLGMSLLPNQPIQTTAIPQTPAVCTAAVKWKNKIKPPDPDKVGIIEKDENRTSDGNKYDKQWSDLVNKSPPPNGGKASDSKDPSTSKEAPDGEPPRTPNEDTNSTARASLVSAEVDKSPVHSIIPQPQQQRQKIQEEDKDADKSNEVTLAESQLIIAIPCMPLSLAVICLILNIFMPGTAVAKWKSLLKGPVIIEEFELNQKKADAEEAASGVPKAVNDDKTLDEAERSAEEIPATIGKKNVSGDVDVPPIGDVGSVQQSNGQKETSLRGRSDGGSVQQSNGQKKQRVAKKGYLSYQRVNVYGGNTKKGMLHKQGSVKKSVIITRTEAKNKKNARFATSRKEEKSYLPSASISNNAKSKGKKSMMRRVPPDNKGANGRKFKGARFAWRSESEEERALLKADNQERPSEDASPSSAGEMASPEPGNSLAVSANDIQIKGSKESSDTTASPGANLEENSEEASKKLNTGLAPPAAEVERPESAPVYGQIVQHERKVEVRVITEEWEDHKLIAAIPCLPILLAVMCLILNTIAPGTGTIISSFSLLCCNKQQTDGTNKGKKESAVDLMITNLCVGISQLFTVTFFFIGFIWSVTWGVFMVQFAYVQYKKDKEERERLAAISVANAFLRPGFR
ncbi:uncharacterized protein [Amphiura filiformis]|uniref:uncharacterized protein n=1 Tax=Amphiura filiformis TaxID=82378 RepID=UPI003B21CC93